MWSFNKSRQLVLVSAHVKTTEEEGIGYRAVSAESGPRLPAHIGGHPGSQALQRALRQLHQDIIDDPLPESFLTLVARIDSKSGKWH